MNSKLTRALPAAAIAVVIAMSVSTGAVAAGMITGKDIKNSSVTSGDLKNNNVTGKDVKDGALTAADLSADALAALKGAPGATGPAGAAGAKGATGAAGAPGISGLVLVTNTVVVANGAEESVFVTCPVGKKMLGMTADWTGNNEATAARIAENLTTGIGYGHNTSGSSATLRGSATCAFVG